MKEFFGFGDYTRTPEGYFSAEHLLFVTFLVLVMITAAVLLGINRRGKSEKNKNRILIISAILIDSLELFKIVIFCIR